MRQPGCSKQGGVDGRTGGKCRGDGDNHETCYSEGLLSGDGQGNLFVLHYLVRSDQHRSTHSDDDIDNYYIDNGRQNGAWECFVRVVDVLVIIGQ